MAYNWDGGEYGHHGNSVQPSVRLRLRNYEGPYDPAALMRARDELLYHVERAQNTATWGRIRMKTPVNVYSIRDDNDGFGEASDAFSHAELAESKEHEVPYQGRQNLIPLTGKANAQQEATCTIAAEEDEGKVNEAEDHDKEDSHESDEEEDSIEMEVTTVEISDSVTIETGDSDLDSDCVVVENDKDFEKDEEQIEIGHDTVKPADALDGSVQIKIDEKDDRNETKFQGTSDESEKKMGSTEVSTVEINVNEKKVVGEQNSESNTENVVVINEDENVELLTVARPMPYSESILKCDHCNVRCSDEKRMGEHLDSAVHYSASKYNVDNEGGLILMKKAVKTSRKAKFKTTVMKCPVVSCSAIFPQMYSCINHFNKKHWKKDTSMQKSQYGLIDLVKEEECSITLKPPKCCQCAEFFETEDKLKRHMKFKGHFPFTVINNCNVSFLCQHCERSFKHFDGLICHQRTHKNTASGVFDFRVLQFKNVRKFVISPKGHLSRLDESVAGPSTCAKRKNSQAVSDNEPNTKVKRTMEGTKVCVQICSETVDNEANNEPDVSESVIDITKDNTDINDAMRKAMNHARSVLSAVKSDQDSPGEEADWAAVLLKSFKCDYCTEISSSREQMISHLNEMCHKSASFVVVNGDMDVEYLRNLSSLVCAEGLCLKAYAACPRNCRLLFSSVKQSIEHFVLCHNDDIELQPCYRVVEVDEEIVFSVSANKCIICGETVNKLKTLMMHFKEKHYPFKFKQGCDTFFRCVYCPRFFQTFKSVLMHVLNHKNLAKNELLDISILYVNYSAKSIELPPKHPEKEGNWKETIRNIQYSIRSLEPISKVMTDFNAKQKMLKQVRALKESLVKKFC